MRVCVDTNVLVQLFGSARPYAPIADALQQGSLELAVSNEILLEYAETLTRLSGQGRGQMVWKFLDGVSRLHSNLLYVEPHFATMWQGYSSGDNGSSFRSARRIRSSCGPRATALKKSSFDTLIRQSRES